MAVIRVRTRHLFRVALALYMCLSLSLPSLLPRVLLASWLSASGMQRGVQPEVDKGWTCAFNLPRGALALTAARAWHAQRARHISHGRERVGMLGAQQSSAQSRIVEQY